MNIGFDAKRYFNNASGLGNYARTLLGDLVSSSGANERFTLFFPGHRKAKNRERTYSKRIEVPIYPLGNIRRTLGVNRVLKRHEVDLYHGLSNELPLNIRRSGIPSVVTVHDVIFKRYPADYPAMDRWIYDIKTAMALDRATQITAISLATQRDLIYYYNIPCERIEVIRQSVHPVFREPPPKPFCPPEEIPAEFLLSVGTLSPRKNQVRILEALALIPKDNRPFIVFIGRGSPAYVQQIETHIHQLGLEAYTAILSGITTEALPAWYKAAKASVYLSLFEGFGLPVLESIYCRTPVIASDIPAIREAGGACAHLINPFDLEQIKSALQHPPAINPDKIDTHLQRFDPPSIALKWRALYRSLI